MLPSPIQRFVDAEVAASTTDYTDLRVVVLNGSLKPTPEISNTDGLIAVSRRVLEGVGARVDVVRLADHEIPPGVYPDMREHGREVDEFPALYTELIAPADIVVLASPIWLGDQSSVTRLVIERLYGYSGQLNRNGQWAYYGKVGGALVTGNEDGGKHCTAQMLYALSHIGFTIPPQADAYWVGEAGPGPSYLDPEGGAHNAWTTRNAVFAAWNMLHTARMLKDGGGVPPHGNVTTNWDLSNPSAPNPEHR